MVTESASPLRFLHPKLTRVVLDVEFLELVFLPHFFELEAFVVDLVEKLGEVLVNGTRHSTLVFELLHQSD